jgi:glycosyltransferase involved in cell wall biosynthesis
MISIVIATVDRLAYLHKTINSIHKYASDYEIVVVDGGSTDGTCDYLLGSPDIDQVILQRERCGAIKAYNAGFEAVKGEYVTWLNDDSHLVCDCYTPAIELLQDPKIGLVAIPFSSRESIQARTDRLRIHGKWWLYANFGVLRKETGDQVNWWGDTHYFYAGDAELAAKMWNLGYQVVALPERGIHHDEAPSGRVPNVDSDDFYRKWRSGWKGPGDDNPIFLR